MTDEQETVASLATLYLGGLAWFLIATCEQLTKVAESRGDAAVVAGEAGDAGGAQGDL